MRQILPVPLVMLLLSACSTGDAGRVTGPVATDESTVDGTGIAEGRAASASAPVTFGFGPTQVTSLAIQGTNLLTGNGIYLIGSVSGADRTSTNYFSAGGDRGRMTSSANPHGGPPFTMVFTRSGTNTLGFRAQVGPVDRDFATMSMPFDFAISRVDRFAFNGSRYDWRCTGRDGSRVGSAATYASIPQACAITDDANRVLGYVGLADVAGAVTWGEVAGSLGSVRVTVTRSSNYRSLKFHHHFGTNNLELSFGRLTKGQTAFVEGTIVVTPTAVPSAWTFEAERDLAHAIGRAEADGWGVRTTDAPNNYLSYGPYTTSIANGSRTATYRLLIDNATADNLRILTLDVYDATSRRVLASRALTRRQFTRAMTYQDFDVGFTAASGQRLEFRTFWHNYAAVRQDRVTVK